VAPTFFLAGLGSQSIDELYRALLDTGVDFVIDIRMARASDLGDELRDMNGRRGGRIGYRWLKYFGNPFIDREDPLESYEGYLVGMDREIEGLYELLMRRRSCIVDDEKLPERSYRMALGEALKKRYNITYADLSVAKELLEKYGGKSESR
jgi:hypothetical protein